jgi:hypothetical protein
MKILTLGVGNGKKKSLVGVGKRWKNSTVGSGNRWKLPSKCMKVIEIACCVKITFS